MCGIAGHVGARRLERDRVDAALAAMRRRGPDAAGDEAFEADGRHVDLLATRLAIIDLDPRANQPFDAGTKHLAYNGEIYNYVELRDQLEREGYPFRTRSDTEVLLAGIDRHGWSFLDRCEGMWALACYDDADGSLTLARDRFGEKPLYVLREGEETWFGSEPKDIAALRGRPLEPDIEQVRRFLVNGYKALYKTPATFFEGLREVPAGTLLHVDRDGGTRTERYWSRDIAVDASLAYDDAVAAVRERLIRSVELRLRSDVPLAFCMSGGVDSTTLISIAKRVCSYDVHGFTIEVEDPRYDEHAAVARSVAELGIRHTRLPLVRTGFLDALAELVRYHDAPVYTISYYAHWQLLERIAGSGYRISISGTGADELFSGYFDHHVAYLAEVANEPALHAAAVAAWEREVRPLVRNPYLGDPELFVRDPGFRDHIFLDADRFAGFLQRPFAEPFAEEDYDGSLLRRRMENELFHEVVPPILHEDDLNAMYHSVENRSPYLDRGLYELARRIPTRHLVRDGRAKAVLRDAARGIAPAHVLDDPRKVGFNAPVEALIDTHDAETRARVLADSPIYDVVRRDKIEELFELTDLPNSMSKFLFSFLSSKAFLDELG